MLSVCNWLSGSSEACRELLTAGADTELADIDGLTRKTFNAVYNKIY